MSLKWLLFFWVAHFLQDIKRGISTQWLVQIEVVAAFLMIIGAHTNTVSYQQLRQKIINYKSA